MQAYVIRQGDTLSFLAATMGFRVEDAWNHPRNDALRELRGDAGVLAPGDIVYLPEAIEHPLPLTSKTTNRYEANVTSEVVSTVLSFGGDPLADEPFEVHGLGEVQQHRTDRDGRAVFDVPSYIREVTIVLPDHGTGATLQLGHLDPLSTTSGIAARLRNLGYLMSERLVGRHPDPAVRAELLQNAVRAFQQDMDLEPTGEVDEATREQLLQEHER